MALDGIEARLNTSEKLTTVPLGNHVSNGHPVCAIEIHSVPPMAGAHDGCGAIATAVQGAPLAMQFVAGVDVSVAAVSWVVKSRIRCMEITHFTTTPDGEPSIRVQPLDVAHISTCFNFTYASDVMPNFSA